MHTIFNDAVIFSTQNDDMLIQHLALTDNEKSLAKIILNTRMYPTDSNGRDRVFEIEDILHALSGKIFDLRPTRRGACFLVVPF